MIECERAHAGKRDEAYKHPDRTGNKRLAATIVLNQVQADEGDAKIDTIENHLCDVRVVDADTVEDRGSVVEELQRRGQHIHAGKA